MSLKTTMKLIKKKWPNVYIAIIGTLEIYIIVLERTFFVSFNWNPNKPIIIHFVSRGCNDVHKSELQNEDSLKNHGVAKSEH